MYPDDYLCYQYRCSHPGYKSSFVFDMLPTKCFPTEQTEERTSKSKSKDILIRAVDYLLFGADDDGQPVTVSDAAKKFGYDRKVISTELHARVNASLSEHILSNEACAQAPLVPFTYRGQRRCAVMGYARKESWGLSTIFISVILILRRCDIGFIVYQRISRMYLSSI